jgi:hypothetical protein
MQQIFIDAVGVSNKAFYEFFGALILSPFVFAFGMILFFKFLDRLSKKKEVGTDNK